LINGKSQQLWATFISITFGEGTRCQASQTKLPHQYRLKRTNNPGKHQSLAKTLHFVVDMEDTKHPWSLLFQIMTKIKVSRWTKLWQYWEANSVICHQRYVSIFTKHANKISTRLSSYPVNSNKRGK